MPKRPLEPTVSTIRSAVLSVLALPTLAFAEATISLKAVVKNGVSITPTNAINIAPNDLVTAEVYLFGWGTPPFDGGSGLVNGFLITLAGQQGALSAGPCTGQCNDRLALPRGWDAPIFKDECPCEDTCFPDCFPHYPFYGCVGTAFDPWAMADMHIYRTDWIFSGLDTCFFEPGSPTLNVVWVHCVSSNDGQITSRCQGGSATGDPCAINANCPGGTCNPNFWSYVGTLYLKAGPNVCGTFTYTFINDINRTFIFNPSTMPISVLPKLEGLTLTGPACPIAIGACCSETSGVCANCATQEECSGPGQRWGGPGSSCATFSPHCFEEPVPVSTVSPSNCTIDARRPFVPGQPPQREGWTSWTWYFSWPPGTFANAPDDFTIRQVPSSTPPVPPIIGSVWVAGNTVTLHFTDETNSAPRPIQPNRWTCVKHNASGVEKCLGFLPGDVNSNRAALPNDILDLIDNLNGLRATPLQPHQCDIDRSGLCAPADILTEIDLLNGANGWPVQNGRTLEPCPSP
jgi:hypothetical protein